MRAAGDEAGPQTDVEGESVTALETEFGVLADLGSADAVGRDGHLGAAHPRLAPGALVRAHNSVNAAEWLADYLRFVRDPARMSASVNVILGAEGLEVWARQKRVPVRRDCVTTPEPRPPA